MQPAVRRNWMQGEMLVDTSLLRDHLGLPRDVEIIGASFQVGSEQGKNHVSLLLKGSLLPAHLEGNVFLHECSGHTWLRTELYLK